MRDANGLQYFLIDHLGSTVAITDSNGTLTSQQRYLPFGGTRANVTAPNSPGTDFGYTGQRQLDADMGGLMDYKARFYSPMLGRFIQPDSIVPAPFKPQSWNRYTYVINNPIIYVDPSGHDIQCSANGDCYETCDYNCAPPLTHKDDPIPGRDETRRHGGDEIKLLFEKLRDKCGWWNDNCASEFTVEQFMGLYIMYENNTDMKKEQIVILENILATITAQNLYVGGFNPAYCRVGGQCDNAVFNFIAHLIDGGSGLWEGLDAANAYAQDTGVPKFGSEIELRDLMSSLGQKALDPSSVITWDQRKGPSSWGNDQSWASALIDKEIWEGFNSLSPDSIYYYLDDAIYFSVDQYNYWK